MTSEKSHPTSDPAKMWSRGDYGVIGANLQEVADKLCAQLSTDKSGHVLDVGAGTGNAALAAARLGFAVTALDVAPDLLDRAAERARDANLSISCVVGTAEALGFPDRSFDATMSTFGVMFAPDHKAAASEMLRVTRPGGLIALANWSPDGVFGASGRTTSQFLPSTSDAPAPALWGQPEYLADLFGTCVAFKFEPDTVLYRYPNVDRYLDVLIGTYPPLINTMAKLADGMQTELRNALRDLYSGHNSATDGTFELPMDYLRAIGRVL